MEYVKYIVIAYLAIMTVVGFIIMGADKKKAKDGAWRVKESTLFLISLIGGSLGTLAGMYFFRHKTRHWYFVVGMPLILLLHIGLGVFLLWKL